MVKVPLRGDYNSFAEGEHHNYSLFSIICSLNNEAGADAPASLLSCIVFFRAQPANFAAAFAPARRPEVRDQPCAQPP